MTELANGPSTEVGRNAVNYLTDLLHASHLRQSTPLHNCERLDRAHISAVIARVETGALSDVAAALEPLAKEAEYIERAGSGVSSKPLADDTEWRRFAAPVGVFRRARDILNRNAR